MQTLTMGARNNFVRSGTLSLLSFNMHGFAQGEELLANINNDNKFDIISVQEHWCNSDGIKKFDKFTNYDHFGVSAMSHLTSSDVLCGRPWGGVITLVNRSISDHVKILLCDERLVILLIGEVVYINIYCPCKGTAGAQDILIDIFTKIADILDNTKYRFSILSGDLNSNLLSSCDQSHIINQYLQMFNMSFIDIMKFNASEVYTFRNDAKSCYTVIDYICISDELVKSVNKYDVIHSPFNFSDHVPLYMNIDSAVLPPLHIIDNSVSNDPSQHFVRQQAKRFRFDHCNVDKYYDRTRVLLEPIAEWLTGLYSNLDYNKPIDESCNYLDIETCYNSVVNILIQASNETVPHVKQDVLKSWWDESLNILKNNCIDSHDAWVAAGKPRYGSVFIKRNEDKNVYRQQIKANKLKNKVSMSDSLAYSLYNHNSVKFWSTWKNKICNKPSTVKIKGCTTEEGALLLFKDYFENISNSTDEKYEQKMSKILDEEFTKRKLISTYKKGSDDVDRSVFSVTLVDIAVSKIKPGKAAGLDNLQKEHLDRAHPILYEILSKLFYLFLKLGYVPDQFGRGIIIPLQKDTSSKGAQGIENFRGITISSVISKVFEQCMLLLFGKHLESSERQFGFKPKVGCSHAVFSINKVVNFFTKNESTVNICCLDISKAFDRLSHNCLLYKLLKRCVPTCFVNMLRNWYGKLYSSIAWGNLLSDQFRVSCGVRQGGILSPVLFTIYVDSILRRLSPYGCRINGFSCGSFMYADDLILLAPSVNELQTMLNISCSMLRELNLCINANKSACIRFGSRCNNACVNLKTDCDEMIPWLREVKYLGVTLVSGKSFNVSFDTAKSKFYSAFNSIYSQLGYVYDISVLAHLLESIAVPMLIYAIEALDLTKSALSNLDFTLNRALFKIFKLNDRANLEYCAEMYGILSISKKYIIRRQTFFKNLANTNNFILKCLSEKDAKI